MHGEADVGGGDAAGVGLDALAKAAERIVCARRMECAEGLGCGRHGWRDAAGLAAVVAEDARGLLEAQVADVPLDLGGLVGREGQRVVLCRLYVLAGGHGCHFWQRQDGLFVAGLVVGLVVGLAVVLAVVLAACLAVPHERGNLAARFAALCIRLGRHGDGLDDAAKEGLYMGLVGLVVSVEGENSFLHLDWPLTPACLEARNGRVDASVGDVLDHGRPLREWVLGELAQVRGALRLGHAVAEAGRRVKGREEAGLGQEMDHELDVGIGTAVAVGTEAVESALGCADPRVGKQVGAHGARDGVEVESAPAAGGVEAVGVEGMEDLLYALGGGVVVLLEREAGLIASDVEPRWLVDSALVSASGPRPGLERGLSLHPLVSASGPRPGLSRGLSLLPLVSARDPGPGLGRGLSLCL